MNILCDYRSRPYHRAIANPDTRQDGNPTTNDSVIFYHNRLPFIGFESRRILIIQQLRARPDEDPLAYDAVL
jgi:hypothetical protein